jgi:hypothetical protein
LPSSYVVVLLLTAVGMGAAVELNDVTECDVVVESEMTGENDAVCGDVVTTVWVVEMSGTVVAVAVRPGLTMSTMWMVFVTIRVSVKRSVVAGDATYMVRKEVFGGIVATTVTVTAPVGAGPGPGPESEPEPEPESDPPEPPGLDPPWPESPFMGTTE